MNLPIGGPGAVFPPPDWSGTLRVDHLWPVHPGQPKKISDAALICRQGRIAAVGAWQSLGARGHPLPLVHIPGHWAPASINAHCHLELSHLKGKTVSGRGFTNWVGSLMRHDLQALDEFSLKSALDEIQAGGTIHVADTGSRNPVLIAQAMQARGLGFTLLCEYFGHKNPEPGPAFARLPPWIKAHTIPAGHALYSTSMQTLQRLKTEAQRKNRMFSMHLAEHQGELELLLHGTGAFRDLLARRVLPLDFSPPGRTPVTWAWECGLLDAKTLAVHCVQLSDRDIKILAESGATVCLCPRSNEYIGVGRARWEDLMQAGIPLCLGTDSPASNHDLNLWNEAGHFLRRLNHPLDLNGLLALMTKTPARILGLEDLGSISPGKRAALAPVPEDILEFFRILP